MRSDDVPVRRLLGALDHVVDGRVGIVKSLEERPAEPGAPAFHHVYSHACNTACFAGYENFRHNGGAAATLERAVAKAVGEAVERYCSAIYDHTALTVCPAESAPFECIDPAVLELYRPEDYSRPDFPWTQCLPSTPVRWTRCVDVLAGREIHVPAAMVHLPYYFHPANEDPPIMQPISTGLACHMGAFGAACAGVYEVVERDAITIAWQAELPLPHVIPETLIAESYDLVERFERVGFRVTILDATMDHGIPTILSVLLSDVETQPAVVVAGAAHLDPERAMRASLEELAHTRRYSHLIKSYSPLKEAGLDYQEVKNQVGHLGYWAEHENRHKIGFLLRSEERVDFGEIPCLDTGHPRENLLVLCRRIESVGCRVLVADLTTDDVRDLGFAVVRAVVPGFHPLFLGHSHRATAGIRLTQTPGRLGLVGRDVRDGGNPLPHPYP
ncbi:MAG: YcaO-like family protein [Acidobacteriota bacterium]